MVKDIKLLFTLIGMDGYFLYKYSNYYIIGEWFLGAIILLYLEYPLLIWVINKHILIIPFILLLLYPLMMFTKIFDIYIQRNLIACTGSFSLGIITAKYYKYFQKKYIMVISLIINIFLTIIKISYLDIIVRQIHGFSLLLFLLFIGNYVMKTKLKAFFVELSKIVMVYFYFNIKLLLI